MCMFVFICICLYTYTHRLPRQLSGKESACQCRRPQRHGFGPWVRKIPWVWKQQPTPVFLPGESHGQRSLVGSSPQVNKELNMTQHVHMSTHACTRAHTHTHTTGSFILLFRYKKDTKQGITSEDWQILCPQVNCQES